MRRYMCMVLLLLTIGVSQAYAEYIFGSRSDYDSGARITSIVNLRRQRLGMRPLMYSKGLTDYSSYYNTIQIEHGMISHDYLTVAQKQVIRMNALVGHREFHLMQEGNQLGELLHYVERRYIEGHPYNYYVPMIFHDSPAHYNILYSPQATALGVAYDTDDTHYYFTFLVHIRRSR